MESYHHIGVHIDSLEKYYPARTTYVGQGSEAYAVLENPAHPKFADPELRSLLPVRRDLAEDELDRFTVYNLFPFHLVAFFPDQVAWFRVAPLSASRSRLDVVTLVAPEQLEGLGEPERAQALHWIDTINREDIAVNASQQLGLMSRRAMPGRLNRLERANVEFADYVSRMLETD